MTPMACLLNALSDTAEPSPHGPKAKLHTSHGAETPLADLRLCPVVSETFSDKLYFCQTAQRTKAVREQRLFCSGCTQDGAMKLVDEDMVWTAHRRFQLEEDILRDFGPEAGGENASGSALVQRNRARRLVEHIIKHQEIPAESYFFQGSSSRGTFLTVSHSQLSDFDVVLLCNRQWLHDRGSDSFKDLVSVVKRYIVSNISREELHYQGRELNIPEHKFALVEGRCGVELKVSVEHAWCEDEATDFVLAYRDGGHESAPIVVLDKWMGRWRKNNPVQVAALIRQVEEKQPYYNMVVRMLKEWNQHCPRIRQVRTGTVVGEVTLLDDELPPEFGGPRDTIVLGEFSDDMKSDSPRSAYKMKQPMTGLHIEMALCLQHDGFRDTFWAKELFSSKNHENRTESMLALAPETPCAIELLVGAVEHLMMTLAVPISTPGDDMCANQAMLDDTELVGKTRQLLHELLLELQRLQQEPETPYASDFLRSRISRDHRLWDEYWDKVTGAA